VLTYLDFLYYCAQNGGIWTCSFLRLPWDLSQRGAKTQ